MTRIKVKEFTRRSREEKKIDRRARKMAKKNRKANRANLEWQLSRIESRTY